MSYLKVISQDWVPQRSLFGWSTGLPYNLAPFPWDTSACCNLFCLLTRVTNWHHLATRTFMERHILGGWREWKDVFLDGGVGGTCPSLIQVPVPGKATTQRLRGSGTWPRRRPKASSRARPSELPATDPCYLCWDAANERWDEMPRGASGT